MNPVLIEYFQEILLSEAKGERQGAKQRPIQDYDPNYHLKRIRTETRIILSHCDLCKLPKEADDIQYRINVLDEIDNSFESENDKHKPRLLICLSCSKEYNIPSYFVP